MDNSQYSEYKVVHFANVYSLEGKGCWESAGARGVPLFRELKHLVLQSESKRLMVHLPANKSLSFGEIRRITQSKSLVLADLSDWGIRKGEVNPFHNQLWKLPHIVDSKVFSLDWMTTNDGTRTGYIRFNPTILLCAEKVLVDIISQDK